MSAQRLPPTPHEIKAIVRHEVEEHRRRHNVMAARYYQELVANIQRAIIESVVPESMINPYAPDKGCLCGKKEAYKCRDWPNCKT